MEHLMLYSRLSLFFDFLGLFSPQLRSAFTLVYFVYGAIYLAEKALLLNTKDYFSLSSTS